MTDNNTRRTALHDLVNRSPSRILQTKYAESFNQFMEQVQYQTPIKSDPMKENPDASPMQWNSPIVTPLQSFIPNKTPIKNPRNPFDANMTEHLHLETFSPSVFSRVLSPSQDQDSNWRIEHVALLNPTDFSPNLHTHLTDPKTEAEAQEKILQFFSQKQIAPSPWSHPRSRVLARSKHKPSGDISQSPTTFKTAWTQTTLSFPPVLPQEVEDLFNQYRLNDPQDQIGHSPASSNNSEGDDSSLNASSLRRKLFTQMSNTPPIGEKSTEHPCARISREQSSSPILTTGPQSSRFSFSPCSSRPVSSPILSPICSHLDEETSVAMDETTRQSWGGIDSQPSSCPERTVLMETYEAGYFSCSSSAAVQSREMNLEDEASNGEVSNFTADRVGQPKECSTPTKMTRI